jgi:ATP/maltotriose-dependent transcriptional regulator MalT
MVHAHTPKHDPRRTLKHILLYGTVGGIAITMLQLIQYRWLILSHSAEVYAALVGVLFVTLGIWLGKRLTRPKVVETIRETVREVVVEVPAVPFVRDDAQVAALGLTPRELDILELIAAGLSNREIAEKAFVSENTVKTHSSRVFDKLGVQRRTQAAQRARELGLIP